MTTFKEFMTDPSLLFQQLMAEAELAFKQEKYLLAWKKANEAEPTSEEEVSYKIHFLEHLKELYPAILQAIRDERGPKI